MTECRDKTFHFFFQKITLTQQETFFTKVIFHLDKFSMCTFKTFIYQPQEKKKSYKEIREEQLRKEAEEKKAKEAAEVSDTQLEVNRYLLNLKSISDTSHGHAQVRTIYCILSQLEFTQQSQLFPQSILELDKQLQDCFRTKQPLMRLLGLRDLQDPMSFCEWSR